MSKVVSRQERLWWKKFGTGLCSCTTSLDVMHSTPCSGKHKLKELRWLKSSRTSMNFKKQSLSFYFLLFLLLSCIDSPKSSDRESPFASSLKFCYTKKNRLLGTVSAACYQNSGCVSVFLATPTGISNENSEIIGRCLNLP